MQVNELRRTLTEQRRHDEERRRQVDVLLTQQLHQDLKLQGAQVRVQRSVAVPRTPLFGGVRQCIIAVGACTNICSRYVMLPRSKGLSDTGLALTAQHRCLKEAHRGLQIQAAKKDQQLALRDQQLEALRRRDEERQRQVDCLLDRELQMQLKLTAYEVRGSDLGCQAISCISYETIVAYSANLF